MKTSSRKQRRAAAKRKPTAELRVTQLEDRVTPAAGDLDTTFGGTGKVLTDFGGTQDFGYGTAVDSLGRIIVAGQTANAANIALARYNANGALDTTFGTGGKLIADLGGSVDIAYAVAVGAGDQPIVAGFTNAGGGGNNFVLARFTTTGAFDTTFGTGGKVITNFGGTSIAHSVIVGAGNSLLVAGFTNVSGTNDFALARYTTTGALDTTFGTGGKVVTDFGDNDVGYSVAIGSGNQPIVGGTHSDNFALVRYTATGALDTTFGTGGKIVTDFGGSDFGYSVAVGMGNTVVVGGYSNAAGTNDFALARYSATGSLDTTFGTGGKVLADFGGANDYGSSVAIDTNGKIILGGYTDGGGGGINFALARFTTTGALDTSFGTGGKVITDFGGSEDAVVLSDGLTLQADGNIVLGGYSNKNVNYDFAVARYLAADTPTVTANIAGNVLTVTDTAGNANNFTLASDGTNITIADAGQSFTFTTSLASVANGIVIQGAGGNDTLTVNLANNLPSVSYDGGTGGNDTLTVTGGTFATVTHRLVNSSDGRVTAGSNVVDYVGLEPVIDNLSATDRVFDFTSATSETITLADSGGADGKMTITSTASESVTFTNPTNLLTIITTNGSGSDTIHLNSYDAAFAGSVSVMGGTGETVNQNAAFTFQANKSLSLAGEFVNFNAASNATVSGTGTIGVLARNVSINATASLSGTGTIVSIGTLVAGDTIDLGGADGATTLGLTDAELDRVTSVGTLRVGNATSGAITVSAAISRPNGVFSLQTGSTVSQNTGATISVSGNSLAVQAGGTITLDKGNSVNSFSATTTTGSINYVEAGGAVSTSSVDGVSGISTSNGSISVSTTGGSITVNGTGPINAGAGNVTLMAGGSNTLTINGTVAGTGGIALNADLMDFPAAGSSINAGAGTVTLLPVSAVRPINLGSEVTGSLSLTDSELDKISAATLVIGSTTGGAVTVSAALTGTPNLTVASSSTISVNQSITQTGTTTLNAPTINLNANIVNAVTGTTATTVNVTSPGQIQDGINVAAASGATVNVAAGTYRESIDLNKPLALVGANAGKSAQGATNRAARGAATILQPLATGDAVGVLVNSGNATIDGFDFLGAGRVNGEYAQVQVFAPNFTFRNNVSNSQLDSPFQPGGQNAIGLLAGIGTNFNNLLIEDSFFARQRNGVFLNPSNAVTSIQIQDNDFASRTGVNSDISNSGHVWNSALVYTLSNNTAGLTTVDGSPFGPVTAFNVGEVVAGMTLNATNNAIASNSQGLRFASVLSGANVNVTGNTFTDHTNGAIGLRLNAALGANVTVSGNTFRNLAYVLNEGAAGFNLSGNSANLGSGDFTLASASLTQLFGVADRVIDAIDVGTFGHVRLRAANVYVTANSFLSPVTTTPSIQRGVNAATSGDTVNVAAGSYKGGILVDRTLTVTGVGSPTVTSADLNGQDVGFQIAADNGVLEGFAITGDGSNEYGVLLSDKNTGPAYTGGTVRNNTFTNLEFGIATADGAVDYTNAQIRNNTITPGTGTWGVYLQSGSGHVVYGNTITGTLGQAGVLVQFADNVTVGGTGPGEGNTFNGLVGSLLVADANNTAFVGNTVTGTLNDRGAIRVEGNVSGIVIAQNTVADGVNPAVRVRQGFSATPSTGIVVNNNTFTGNTYGIKVDAGGLGDTLDARFNSIAGSTIGTVLNNSTGLVNVSGSYLGSAAFTAVFAGVTGTGPVDYTPYLTLATDTSAAAGFQGDFSDLTVHTAGAQTGGGGRITEGYNSLAATGTLRVLTGSYTENVDFTAGPNRAVTLAPGASPGQVVLTGNLTLNANDTLEIEIGGTNATTDYDNLLVTGMVNLGGATLSLLQFASFTVTPSPLQTFTIIDNDGTDPVTGIFAGLPEGTPITYAGGIVYVSYSGGDGNDVVLYSSPVVNGTAAADTFVFRRVTASTDYEISINGGAFVNLGTIASLVVNGLDGNDTLTIDNSNGNALLTNGITFNGGNQTGTPGDTLAVIGGTFTTIVNNFTSASSGNIVFDGKVVTYTGLEPVLLDVGTVGNVVFNLPAVASDAVLEDDGTTGNGLSQLRSANSTFETTTFTSPTSSLTVNTGNAADIITVTSVPDFVSTVNLTLGTSGASFTSASFTGTIGVNNLSVFAVTIGNTGTANVSATGNANFGGATIDIGNVTGDSFNFGTLTFNSTGSTSISENSSTSITGTNTAASLSLTSTAGITNAMTASLNVTNNASFSGTTIDLGNQTGDNFSFGSLTFNGSGSVNISEDSGTQLLGTNTANSLLLSSTATVSDATGTTVTVTTTGTFSGTVVDLTDTAMDVLSIGTVATFLAISNVLINTSGSTNFGSLTVSASGVVLVFEDSATAVNTITTAATIVLISAGAITDNNAGANNLSGTAVTLSATTGIDLDTNIGSLTATTSGAGNILIDEADAITLTNVETMGGGSITITAGGTVTATRVVDPLDASHVVSITTTAGDILVNLVRANGDTVTLNAAGAIEETGGDSTEDLVGSIVNLTAANGIGGAGTIEINTITTVNRGLTASVTGTGGIDLLDTTGGLRVRSATTANGNIRIVATGGDIVVETISAVGTVTLMATNAITDANAAANNVTGTTGTFTAGTTVELDTTLTNLALMAGGNATIREADGLNLNSVSVGANVFELSTGGTTTQTGAILAGGFRFTGSGTATLTTMTNDVDTLAASRDGSLSYTDATSLIVGSVTGATGTTSGITLTPTGSLTLSALTGMLTVNNAISAPGTIAISATDPTAATLAVNAAISGGPMVSLSTAGGNDALTVSATGSIMGTGMVLVNGNAGTDTFTIDGPISGSSANVLGGGGTDTFNLTASGASLLTLDGQDAADTYTITVGTLDGTVEVSDTGTSGKDSLTIQGTTAADTYEVNTAISGNATAKVLGTGVSGGADTITYTATLEAMTLDAQGDDDTYNLWFAQGVGSFLPALVTIADSGTSTNDIANLSGTNNADSIDVNFTTPRTTTSGSETVAYTNKNLDVLNVFAKDANDVVRARAVTNDGGPVVNLNGGDPQSPTTLPGDILVLNVLGQTGLVGANIKTPDGNLTSTSHNLLTWTSFETIPVPIGLGGTFDFGTATSPVQAGPYSPYWTRVVGTDLYPTAGYYGWTKAVNSYDRGSISSNPAATDYQSLLRDGNWFGPLNVTGTFRVATIASGNYQVSVTIGDAGVVMDFVFVTIEGLTDPIAVPRTNGNEFVTVTGIGSDVNVDGKLDITFVDKAGTHSFWHVNALDVRPVNLVSPVTIDRIDPTAKTVIANAARLADGLSTTTYQAAGFFPNSVATIGTTNGSLIGVNPTTGANAADIDLFQQGLQVRVDANGIAYFRLAHPSGNGTVTLKASSALVNDASGTYSQAFTLPTNRKIDFNTGTPSPTEAGYLGVGPTVYTGSATNGLGWITVPFATDRATGGPLFQDFHWGLMFTGGQREFNIDVPTADPQVVTFYFGETQISRDLLTLEYFNGSTYTPLATSFATNGTNSLSFTVTPAAIGMGNFQMRFRFGDLGGVQNGWSVQGIEYRRQADQVVLGVTPTTPVAGDGIFVQNYAISNGPAGGLVTVTTKYGAIVTADASSFYDGVQVLLDGSGNGSVAIRSPLVAAGTVDSPVNLVTVNGTHGFAFAQQYTGAKIRHDFGPAAAPVEAGFKSISGTATFNNQTGVGFKAPAIDYDRNPTTYPALAATGKPNLYRDGSYGDVVGVYRVLVQPGSANVPVTVYVFDPDRARNNITVTGEGGATQTKSSTTTTPAVFNVLANDTNNDGILEVSISAVSIWIANGIEIGSSPLRGTTTAATGGDTLTAETLAPVAAEALRRLSLLDLTPEQRSALNAVTITTADLDAVGRLGEAGGTLVKIDDDANGAGWFIDATPTDDSEFTTNGVELTGDIAGYDLLTVVTHELGHIVGWDDRAIGTAPGHVMTEELAPATRRLATLPVMEEAMVELVLADSAALLPTSEGSLDPVTTPDRIENPPDAGPEDVVLLGVQLDDGRVAAEKPKAGPVLNAGPIRPGLSAAMAPDELGDE